jgi:DNA polymerase-3 subunit epsilon
MMRCLVFDTETTGLLRPATVALEHQPKIIELGIAIVEDGEVVSEHNWLINPGELITDEINKITGITNDELAGQRSFREIWTDEAHKLFIGCDAVIAHNLPFDKGMVDNEMRRMTGEGFGCGWPSVQICTVQEFKHIFGHRPKLTDLYKRYVGEPKQTHRAIEDVRMLVAALQATRFFHTII